MAYYRDLKVSTYLPHSEGLGFIAVGWLEPDHDYSTGVVSVNFFEKLLVLLQNPWMPPYLEAGFHECGFCRFSRGLQDSYCYIDSKQYHFSCMGKGYIFIPNGSTVFVAPTNIAHYVDAHEYRPPDEFQKAVIDCPKMRSPAYLERLLATPVREWLKRLEKEK
jgi:hypothetical protein